MPKRTLLLLLTSLLATPLAAAEIEAQLLLYQGHEPGQQPFPSRILVTDEYLRLDDGIDNGDYVLFDRKQQHIASVTHGDGTVFEISSREVTTPSPMPLERRVEELSLPEGGPTIAGMKPRHRALYVNDTLCYNVIALPQVFEDAVSALRDYRRVLAGEQGKLLPTLPADMQQPCDLALNTFHPTWSLEYGLPIQEWDEQGKGQQLMDLREGVKVDSALFTLPEGYRHYTTD